jgi:hypothetical protein
MRTLSNEEVKSVSGASAAGDLFDRLWLRVAPKSYYAVLGFLMSALGG